MKRTLITSLAV